MTTHTISEDNDMMCEQLAEFFLTLLTFIIAGSLVVLCLAATFGVRGVGLAYLIGAL